MEEDKKNNDAKEITEKSIVEIKETKIQEFKQEEPIVNKKPVENNDNLIREEPAKEEELIKEQHQENQPQKEPIVDPSQDEKEIANENPPKNENIVEEKKISDSNPLKESQKLFDEKPEEMANMDPAQAAEAKRMLENLNIEEPLEEVEVANENINEEKDNSEQSQEDADGIDFTIIKKEDYPEDMDEVFEPLIPSDKKTIELSNIPEENDELEASFEIVHHHDIYLLPDGEYNKAIE